MWSLRMVRRNPPKGGKNPPKGGKNPLKGGWYVEKSESFFGFLKKTIVLQMKNTNFAFFECQSSFDQRCLRATVW